MGTLKKVSLALIVIFFASCDKFTKQEDEPKTCPCVSNESVPTSVQSSFASRYPLMTAEKWFNKDDNGFVAVFTQNKARTLAQFDNNGVYKTEFIVPESAPSNEETNLNGNPKKKCGERRHRPRPLGFLRPKPSGNCQGNRPDREKGCRVELEN